MQRNKIYINILDVVANNFLDTALTAPESHEYNNHKAALEFREMADIVLTKCNNKLKPLLNVIKTPFCGDALFDESISVTGYRISEAVSHRKKSLEREFIYGSPEIICIDYLKFKESIYTESLMPAIERICSSTVRCKKFLESIIDGNFHGYALLYKPLSLGVIVGHEPLQEDLYFFALLKYLNGAKTLPLATDIDNRVPSIFNTTLNYTNDVWYRQYLDIYDVINEWQHASDYLMSFLKMYQAMEFLAYRCQLADLVNKADMQHSFLRAVKDLDANYHKGERATFIKQLSPLFDNFTVCNPLILPEVEQKVEEFFGLDDQGNRYLKAGMTQAKLTKAILRFIYDVRCSLVHNKESEFHITYTNYTEYEALVPLMKEVQKVVAKRMMELLSQPMVHFSYKPNINIELF